MNLDFIGFLLFKATDWESYCIFFTIFHSQRELLNVYLDIWYLLLKNFQDLMGLTGELALSCLHPRAI